MGDGEGGRAEAVAVAACGEDVELGGDLRLFESAEVDDDVLGVDGVVFGLEEKGGRCGGSWLECWVEGIEGWGSGEVAGVDDEGEVGGGIGGGVPQWICGCAGAGVVGVRGESYGEMGAGGEAEDADAVAVEMPLGGVGAGDAHGLLGVFEVLHICREVAFFGDAVLDQDAGDVDGVEPGADLGTLEIVGEDGVSAAGEDNNCGSVGSFGGRVEGEAGFRNVGEPGDPLASGEVVGGLGGVVLGLGDVRGFWGAAGPEREGLLLGEGEGTKEESGSEESGRPKNCKRTEGEQRCDAHADDGSGRCGGGRGWGGDWRV